MKDASKLYETFTEVEKDEFTEDVTSDVELSERQVGRKARQIFCQMQKMVVILTGLVISCYIVSFLFFQFADLEQLGYRGFSVAFCNDKYNVAGSDSVLPALSRHHLDYLYSFIFYGMQIVSCS